MNEGRPTKEYRATLRKATRRDYMRLLRGTLEALLQGHTDVLFVSSYLTKFPKDFPKGVLHWREGKLVCRRVKAKKLLNWLREHGHTDITMELLKGQQISFTKQMKEVEIGVL